MKTLILVLALAGLAAGETAPRPSWECLPAGTMLAVNVPQPAAFGDLVMKTRAGQAWFSADRCAKTRALVERMLGGEAEAMRTAAAAWNLTEADVGRLLHGAFGIAAGLLPGKDKDGDPMPVVTLWCEPSGDLADRLFAALDRWIATAKPDAAHFRRTDEPLGAGTLIRILATPGVLPEGDGALGLDVPEAEAAALFIHRLGNRILIVGGLRESEAALKEHAGAFIAAHAAATPAAFAAAIAAHPQIAQAPLSGVVAGEIHVDLQPLLRAADASADPEAKQVRTVFGHLGLDRLGPIAVRVALSPEGMVSQELSVALPAPRTSVAGLIDQKALPAAPPAWVPASVVTCARFSLDLGGLYEVIRETTLKIAGASAQAGFQTLEQQVQVQTGSDFTTVLRALGHRITFLDFPMPAGATPDLAKGEDFNRIAVVWELADEAVAGKLLTVAGGFLAMAGGVYSEEQGFKGYRLPNPMGQGEKGGLFLGRGHLALALGPGVSAEVLSALATPPVGDQALGAQPLLRQVSGLLPAREGTLWAFSDVDRDIATTLPAVSATLGQLAMVIPDLNDLPGGVTIAEILTLVPTADELKGTMGPSGSLGWADEQGLTLRSRSVLPMATK